MKKLLTLLLSILLLLPLFAGCQSEPEPEPEETGPTKMIWSYTDLVAHDGVWWFKQPLDPNEGNCTERLQQLLDDPETDDALFQVMIENAYLKSEWKFEKRPMTRSDCFFYLPQEEEYFAATLTKEELLEVLKTHVAVLTVPSRPEGYSEKISDSLAATLEYLPQETYQIRIGTQKADPYGGLGHWTFPDTDFEEGWWTEDGYFLPDSETPEQIPYLTALLERHGLLGAFDPEQILTPPDLHRNIDENGIDRYGTKEDGYCTGTIETNATKEQILALAEDEDVRTIFPGTDYYHSTEYFITGLEEGEPTTSTTRFAYTGEPSDEKPAPEPGTETEDPKEDEPEFVPGSIVGVPTFPLSAEQLVWRGTTGSGGFAMIPRMIITPTVFTG